MKEKMIIFVTLLILFISLVDFFISRNKRKKKYIELTELLTEKDFNTFYEVVDSDETKKQISVFDVTYLKYVAAIMIKDSKRAFEEILKVEKITKTKKQKISIYIDAFYYFIDVDNKEAMKYCYERLKEYKQFNTPENQLFYNVYCENRYDYLDETINAIETSPDSIDKVNLILLVSKMYKNKGDINKSKEYSILAKKLLEKIEKPRNKD